MPLEFQIIRASEFIRLDAQDNLDLASSAEVLLKLVAACRLRKIHLALLDMRHVGTVLTPSDLASLVRVFRKRGFTHKQRVAILHVGDPNYRARLFSVMSTMRGWKVRAFSDFDEAMTWLSNKTKTVAARRKKGVSTRPNRSVRTQ